MQTEEMRRAAEVVANAANITTQVSRKDLNWNHLTSTCCCSICSSSNMVIITVQ